MNFSPENRAKICELSNSNEKQFVEDVDFLRKWLLEQPHLPKVELNDNFIGNFLLRHKFSIERTKKALDMFFTIRTTFPEVYNSKDPKIIAKEKHYDNNVAALFSKYTTNLKQVLFIATLKPQTYNPRLMFQKMVNLMEFALQDTGCLEEIIVFDFKNFLLEDILKINPMFFIKTVKTSQEIYSVRTKAVYLINNKPYLDPIVKILKVIIKDKLFQRIRFDVGFDSLKEALPKDMIPKDYGGDGPTLEELSKNFDSKILKNSQFFDSIANMKVDENLRPPELNSNVDDMFGIQGSFKQLNID